ncbi:MAG: fluoride efflux transporter CrcB [Acidobacteria bacterium]|nr:fluoride efflux transporter CrcB [Acidobacteriota bacterium]
MEKVLKRILVIAAGGGLGAILRYLLSEAVYRISGPTFPWGTLTVNLVGCYLIGLAWQYSEMFLVSSGIRIFILTGVLGAFTTFSTFSLETLTLLRDGEIKMAVSNQILSVAFGLILVIAGTLTVRYIHGILH